jgi:hypothetical protein
MGTAYFGAVSPITTLNGDWANVSQWYSDPGYNDDGYQAGTLLNRLPLANDQIYIYQNVMSNAGTVSANVYVAGGGFNDPTAVWSGLMTVENYMSIDSGTFSGNVYTPYYVAIDIRGGTFTNTFTLSTGGLLTFANKYVGPGYIDLPLTIASNASFNTQYLYVYRSEAWNGNLKFQRFQLNKSLVTGTYPPISKDISTAYTDCKYFELNFYGDQSTNATLSTIFTNTNPIIMGTANTPCSSAYLFNLVTDKPIIIYTDFNTSISIGTQNSSFYSALYNFTLLGNKRVVSYISGNATLYATKNIPIIYNSTSKTIDSTLLPQSYGFGTIGGSFVSNTILVQSPNIGANLE